MKSRASAAKVWLASGAGEDRGRRREHGNFQYDVTGRSDKQANQGPDGAATTRRISTRRKLLRNAADV